MTQALDLSVKAGPAGTAMTIPVYSDFANAVKHWTDGEFTIGDVTAPADIAIGVLSAVLDPLNALIGAAVGSLMDFLVSNVSWLKEPVDLLLGNPDAIFQHAQKWQKISTDLVEVANTHAETAHQLPSWEGPASDAYTEVLKNMNENFKAGSGAAARMADWVTAAGTGVAMFRDLIWGLVKQFVTEAVEAAILAAASAIPSLGASLAAFTGWFGAKMAAVGAKVTSKLAKLMRWLSKIAKKMGMSGKSFDNAAKALSNVSQKLARSARTAIQSGRTTVPTSGRHAKPNDPIPLKPEMPGKTSTKDVLGKEGAEVYDKLKDLNKKVVKPFDKGQTKGTTEYGENPDQQINDVQR